MTDAQKRIMYCNNRYLEIYGLARSEYSKEHDRAGIVGIAARARRARHQRRGFLQICRSAEGLITELPNGTVDSGQVFWAAERRFR